jgi:serine/threonine protein phosphatase PrpC
MEDAAVIIDPYGEGVLGDEESWGFFGVYDGHGGRLAADYCETNMHEVVLNELRSRLQPGKPLTDEQVAQALDIAFQSVDNQLQRGGSWHYGCTASVVLTRRMRGGELRLHVANVGDSRCIAVNKHGGETRITRDHRPTDINEISRIEIEGGFVARGRVGGQLGVSRALGDHSLKSAGVTSKPYTCSRDAKQDAALVLASDGLWDALSDKDARVLVEQSLALPQKAAQLLVSAAQRRGSTDNIICVVVFLGI